MIERLYEHPASGLKLRVQFTRDESDVVHYESVHAVDADYRACGPDLLGFLQYQLETIDDEGDGNLHVTPLLALIAEDLEG